MKLLAMLITLCFAKIAYSQETIRKYTQIEKDSLRALTCEIHNSDQAIRDSMMKAYNIADTSAYLRFAERCRKTDSFNILRIKNLLATTGLPTVDMIGPPLCDVFVVLYHWSKADPGGFNSPEIVKLLKKEIDHGNLPLPIVDMSHFLYVKYMETDMKYFELINRARKVYGLKEYTENEYTGVDNLEFNYQKSR